MSLTVSCEMVPPAEDVSARIVVMVAERSATRTCMAALVTIIRSVAVAAASFDATGEVTLGAVGAGNFDQPVAVTFRVMYVLRAAVQRPLDAIGRWAKRPRDAISRWVN